MPVGITRESFARRLHSHSCLVANFCILIRILLQPLGLKTAFLSAGEETDCIDVGGAVAASGLSEGRAAGSASGGGGRTGGGGRDSRTANGESY